MLVIYWDIKVLENIHYLPKFTLHQSCFFAGEGFMNTFQLIAFLLSIFNIAALMVSNANNNNRNDNINDNQV